MKILRIVPTMNPKAGGVAESIRQSALQMKDENINIEVVCFDNPNSSWIEEFDFKVYGLSKGKTSYGFNLSYLSWLNKNVNSFDLVIIDGLWMFHVVGGYICKLKQVPYLIYSHGMLDPYFNKDKLKYLKKLPFWFLVERNIIALARNIVFTCKEEMFLAKKSFPYFKGNSSIATLGIERNNQSRQVLKEKFLEAFPHLRDKKIGLFLSRIHEKKGLDLLIDAVGSCREILPENFVFVIAGTGDENYIKKLKDQVSKQGLEQYFEWVGMLSGNMKWGAFASSEFFILPSHQENFGIVVAEALSQNLPVLMTNKVNIWREIKNYRAGLVENDDIQGVTKLIVDYFSIVNKDILKMKENTLVCFNDRFSTDAFRQDFLKLLNVSEKK